VFTDAKTSDQIVDFTVSQGDVLSFDISDLALNAADFAAGAGVVATAAVVAALVVGWGVVSQSEFQRMS